MIKYHTFGNQDPFWLFIKLTLISLNLKKWERTALKLEGLLGSQPSLRFVADSGGWVGGGGGGGGEASVALTEQVSPGV